MLSKTEYKKITREQVLDILIQCHVNFMNPTDVISIPNIACLLKTSTYQVRKYINELKKDGLVQLDIYHYQPLKNYRCQSKGFV